MQASGLDFGTDSSAQQRFGLSDRPEGNGEEEESYMVMRRCQSVEEGPSRHLRHGGHALLTQGGGAYLAPPTEELRDLSNFVGASSLSNLQTQSIHSQPSPRNSPHTRPRQQHLQQQQQQAHLTPAQQQQQPPSQIPGLQGYQNLKFGSHAQYPDPAMITPSVAANQIPIQNGNMLQLSECSDNDGEYSETVI